MGRKRWSVPRRNCLKYTLRNREARCWFILPQDSDHWAHEDRRRRMIERVAVCAQQNGFAGVQVFHPSGVHLMTVCYESQGDTNCMGFFTESGGAELEEKIGDVSQSGQHHRSYAQWFCNQKHVKWRRHNLLPLSEQPPAWGNKDGQD